MGAPAKPLNIGRASVIHSSTVRPKEIGPLPTQHSLVHVAAQKMFYEGYGAGG
jgi:hypothetical protein